MPVVVIVGAAAGFAVVGRGTTVPGDMVLTLDASTTMPVAPTASDPPPTDSTVAPTLAPDQAAARIVLAVVTGWDQAALDALTASLAAEGFTDVIVDAASVDAATSGVRVGSGFDAAAAVVARVLGLSVDVIEPLDGAPDAWSAIDEEADVLVLLGSDLRG